MKGRRRLHPFRGRRPMSNPLSNQYSAPAGRCHHESSPLPYSPISTHTYTYSFLHTYRDHYKYTAIQGVLLITTNTLINPIARCVLVRSMRIKPKTKFFQTVCAQQIYRRVYGSRVKYVFTGDTIAVSADVVQIHWVKLVVGSTGKQFVDNQNNNKKNIYNRVLSRPEIFFK